jgi:hypothetical protein
MPPAGAALWRYKDLTYKPSQPRMFRAMIPVAPAQVAIDALAPNIELPWLQRMLPA